MKLSPTFESGFARAFASGFAAADRRSIPEWCADKVTMGSWSPWPGKMSFAHTPWLIEPLLALRRERCHRITILAAAAGGKSTIAESFMGWTIRNAPGFFCWFSHTQDTAKEFAETRLWPFLESIPEVEAIMPRGADRHKKRSDGIIFPHMALLVLPANETSAQSKHIRYAVFDEPWLYKPGILAQLHKRTTKFAHNRKILELSTGSVLGDETDQAFRQGTQREWQLCCPKCEQLHIPLFSPERLDEKGGVRWNREAKRSTGEWDFDAVRKSVYYECPVCAAQYKASEENQHRLNRGADYTAGPPDAEHESFHWPAWASDFRLLGDFAVEFLQAKAGLRRGTVELLQEFTQKRQAVAWDASVVDSEPTSSIVGDYAMGDPWPEAQCRIMAIDVQKTHFWVTVRDWSIGPKTRLVWAGRLETEADCRKAQQDYGVIDERVFMDSGHFTDRVYQICCRFNWNATKGEKAPNGFTMEDGGVKFKVPVIEANGEGVPMSLPMDAKVRSCPLYRISEEMTSERLHLFRTGRAEGWTNPSDTPKEYAEQMAARVRRARQNPKTGQTYYEWVTIARCGEHLWDCERSQIAGAFLCDVLDAEAEQPKEEKK